GKIVHSSTPDSALYYPLFLVPAQEMKQGWYENAGLGVMGLWRSLLRARRQPGMVGLGGPWGVARRQQGSARRVSELWKVGIEQRVPTQKVALQQTEIGERQGLNEPKITEEPLKRLQNQAAHFGVQIRVQPYR